MSRRRFLAGIVGLLIAALPSRASAQIRVAAASDLQTVLPEVASRFQRATGQTVQVSYGSSGQFVSQLQNGAPFDLFLSADEEYVARLVASGHADGSTAVTYATARLALWTRSDRGIDITVGLTCVTNPRVRRIAIANPEHAPYGRAAVEALRRAGLYEQVRQKLVLGENVSQAAQFAQSGNADLGIIAMSLALASAMQSVGTAVEITQDAFPVIQQTGVVVAASAQKDAARRFLNYLRDPGIATLLRASGFGTAP